MVQESCLECLNERQHERMIFRLTILCALFLTGCDAWCRRRMIIVPGLTWEYYSLHDSRIVSDKYGVVVEGDVFLTFYEYGFDVCGGGKRVYVDLKRNALDDSIEMLTSLVGEKSYGTFDASSAMGMFARDAHLEYLDLMKSLKERVKMKLEVYEDPAL